MTDAPEAVLRRIEEAVRLYGIRAVAFANSTDENADERCTAFNHQHDAIRQAIIEAMVGEWGMVSCRGTGKSGCEKWNVRCHRCIRLSSWRAL